jgi:EAL domain-containing protein (putative c-di-GMP-specific phosphodiesterase class I)
MVDVVRFANLINQQRCRVAIDDFSVGLSAFAYLRDLPVDILKIDGSFLRRAMRSSVDRKIFRTIADLGHALKLTVVAEHVETAAAWRLVHNAGIQLEQGNGLHRPRPLDELDGATLVRVARQAIPRVDPGRVSELRRR